MLLNFSSSFHFPSSSYWSAIDFFSLISMETSGSRNSKTSSGKSAIDELSNPNFLYHSDNPSLIPISQPLIRDNYVSWSRAMLITLFVKNKLGFIDGLITKPEGNDLNLLNSWIRNNNIVIFSTQFLRRFLLVLFFFNSAYEIWLDLMDWFQ